MNHDVTPPKIMNALLLRYSVKIASMINAGAPIDLKTMKIQRCRTDGNAALKSNVTKAAVGPPHMAMQSATPSVSKILSAI